jgi:hypothetical protein
MTDQPRNSTRSDQPEQVEGERWEVRDNHAAQLAGVLPRFAVMRGAEIGAAEISDYGLACVIEAALNFRDGTVDQ